MSHYAIIHKSAPGLSLKRTGGSSLGMALVLTSAVLVLTVAIFDFTQQSSRLSSRRVNEQATIRLAEGGIEKAVWCLNNPTAPVADCPGNPTNYVGESNVSLGSGTYTVSVSGTGNSKTITATGTIAGSGGTTTKQLEVRLTTTSSRVAFQYGLQAGTGGITMGNNSRVIGSVYSNGSVTGVNNTEVTGDVVLAVGNATVNAAANPNPNSFTIMTFGDASSTKYVVQSFSPTMSDKVYEVDLKIARVNNPTSNLTVEIRNNNSGQPGITVLGSKTIDPAILPNSTPSGWENGWTEVNVVTNSALTAGTTYWVTVEVNNTNTTKYFQLVRANDDAVYTSGTAKIGSNFSSLSALCNPSACDIAFQVKMGGSFPILKVSGIAGGAGVGGNAFANTIDSTKVAKHACYQTLVGTVSANNGSETCSGTSTGPVPCASANTQAGVGPYCHPNNPDPIPAPFPLTTAQIAQMEAQAEDQAEGGGVTTCSPTCTINHGATLGPRKYVGNVTFDGNAQTTLAGTLWVTGKLTLTNNNRITLSEGYGANGGIIIAHDPADETTKGKIFLDNNVGIFRNSNTSSNILMIAMNNSDDSNDPAFKADNNVNNADGVNDSLEALIIYGHNGVVFLGNNVGPDEITGKRIELFNNTEITYTSGLASTYFSSGPGAAWAYQKGTYRIF